MCPGCSAENSSLPDQSLAADSNNDVSVVQKTGKESVAAKEGLDPARALEEEKRDDAKETADMIDLSRLLNMRTPRLELKRVEAPRVHASSGGAQAKVATEDFLSKAAALGLQPTKPVAVAAQSKATVVGTQQKTALEAAQDVVVVGGARTQGETLDTQPNSLAGGSEPELAVAGFPAKFTGAEVQSKASGGTVLPSATVVHGSLKPAVRGGGQAKVSVVSVESKAVAGSPVPKMVVRVQPTATTGGAWPQAVAGGDRPKDLEDTGHSCGGRPYPPGVGESNASGLECSLMGSMDSSFSVDDLPPDEQESDSNESDFVDHLGPMAGLDVAPPKRPPASYRRRQDYWDFRARNNASCRKSRHKRKVREIKLAIEERDLLETNSTLKAICRDLESKKVKMAALVKRMIAYDKATEMK